jgi:16S rRNA (adenine1518-N6/adenine1519-N6)-dimethyltransferase
VVPPEMFTPPPKVNSQVIIIRPLEKPRFPNLDEKKFFRVVKAGFSERRKKLRSSLAGGLGISKPEAEALLKNANIDSNLRAQDLSLENWLNLSEQSII